MRYIVIDVPSEKILYQGKEPRKVAKLLTPGRVFAEGLDGVEARLKAYDALDKARSYYKSSKLAPNELPAKKGETDA